MFSEAVIFLIILFFIGLLARNSQLMIAVGILLVLKWTSLGEAAFPYLRKNGIHIGIIVMTLSVLTPIAMGEIGLKDLLGAARSSTGWLALLAGILVSLLGKNGVGLLSSDPTVTVSLVIGTILAVSLFKGVAVGPLIGAGIAYWLINIFAIFRR